MGFIRGAAITLFSIILFFSLLIMGLTLTLSLSVNHDNLQPVLKDSASGILRGAIGGGNLFSEEERPYMENYCSIFNNSPYSFQYDNYNFSIPCEVIEQGDNAIIDYGATNFVDQIYYTEYNCEFWDCVKASSIPFVLFSQKAEQYWTLKFLLLAGLSLLIFALTFLISKNRSTTFIVTGVLLILSALPLKLIGWILTLVAGNMAAVASLFFSKANSVFTLMLIFGIAFIVAGIVCKIFGWRMKFTKDEEEIQREELAKQKQRKKQVR